MAATETDGGGGCEGANAKEAETPNQGDAANFKFSSNAAEFVPGGGASKFQFNPSASEFQPTPTSTPTGNSRPQEGQWMAAGQVLVPVPVVAIPGMGVYPVMALQSPGGGQRPTTIAYVSSVSPMGAGGAVRSMGAFAMGGYDGSGGQQMDSRKGGGKGGYRQQGRGRQGYYSPHGQWANYEEQQVPYSAANAGGSVKNAGISSKRAAEDEAANAEEEEKQEEEEEPKDPSKRSWADIARESAAKQSQPASAAASGPVPSVASPKAVRWGPASKSAAPTTPSSAANVPPSPSAGASAPAAALKEVDKAAAPEKAGTPEKAAAPAAPAAPAAEKAPEKAPEAPRATPKGSS
eukprot:CAMPEP_0195064842 /NCGR_PEP_ID=MMETSP0448-20130528/10699_1 /TAXON_ID=66468 /ORGANISM="Heterocapsa triquestra, Strain CCMP 448" /LENGTH=349 /DNA_ID=CAMNT_0040095883 /DNA_START=49 /DNA_END=1095 /DNA_ORIENTATION=+